MDNFWHRIFNVFTVFVLIVVLIIIFTILSFFITKLLKKVVNKTMDTNVDNLINRVCIVVEEINNILGKGKIIIDNNIWSASSENDDIIIDKDTKVKIKNIQGVRLIVSEIKEDNL